MALLHYIACSLIAAALILKHYVPANVSKKSNITIKYSIKMLRYPDHDQCVELVCYCWSVILPDCSTVSEMIIFMFLGLSLFDTAVLKWDTGLVLWTILFAIIFRPIGNPLAPLFSLPPKPQLKRRM